MSTPKSEPEPELEHDYAHGYEAGLIDRFMDALRSDPHAPTPAGLASETAAFVRLLVQAESAVPPCVPDVPARIWMRALAAARLENASNGHGSQVVPDRQTISMEEDMYIADTTITRKTSARRPVRAYSITLLAAVAGVVLFGALLLLTGRGVVGSLPNPSTGGAAAPVTATPTAVPTPTPTPVLEPGYQAPMSVFELGPLEDIQPIEIRQVVQGTITDEAPVASYRFVAETDIVLRVDATSTTFLPINYATTYSEAGPSSGGSFLMEPAGFIVALGAGEELYLWVSKAVDGPSGDFALRLDALPEPVHLAYGETVEGAITGDARFALFAFTGAAGDRIDIVVDSGGVVDTQMSLFASVTGGPLTVDEDSGAGFDPEILDMPLYASMGYYLVVGATNPGEAGAFTLALDGEVNAFVVPTPVFPPTGDIDAVPVEIGKTVKGSLTADDPEATYTLTLEEAGTLVVFVASPDFMPGFSHMQYVEDAGGGGGGGGGGGSSDTGGGALAHGSTLRFLPIADGARVWLTVSSDYSAPSEGSFTLSVRLLDDAVPAAHGETVQSALTEMMPFQLFRLEAAAGEIVTVGVDGGDMLDSRIQLLDANGVRLVEDDDGGPGANPEINKFVLAQDGPYYVVVEPQQEGESGAFEITVSVVSGE
ncbi:MAG: PPC domain-containing protein [Anaerolineae bacterium]|nr:PPC domain-containing protein [Anaerolineae bacterium]